MIERFRSLQSVPSARGGGARAGGRTVARGAVAAALLVALAASPGAAPALELKGVTADEIVHKVNAREEGVTLSQTLKMELIDRRGKTRERETRAYRKYYDGEKRTIIYFEAPRNVKDTAFLTYDYPDADREDDQWLYLPALRKVRRISASNRGDSFLGTDFSYEDMKKAGKISEDDYHFELIGSEVVDGHECYKVEAIPVSEDVAEELKYGRVVLYVDPEIWMSRKAEVWDVRGNPLKVVHTRDIRKVQGIWTAHSIVAENHKTGHRSHFTISDVTYDGGKVDDDLFTERALRRGL